MTIVTTRPASNLLYCKLTAQKLHMFSQASATLLRQSIPCSNFHWEKEGKGMQL